MDRQEWEDPYFPPVDGRLFLDDLPLSDPDDAVGVHSAAPRSIEAYVVRALNQIGPTIASLHRQGSARATALMAFDSTLRELVDQWLEAGKQWHIQQGLQRKRNDPEGRLKRDAWRLTWHTPEYLVSIFQTLTQFWERNPIRGIVGADGRLTACSEPTPLLHRKNLSQDARNRAIWIFQIFLQSRKRELLSRCEGCKKYFVRARAPKQEVSLKHGTFCRKCKGLGGARRTLASREQKKRVIIELAADLWIKWKQTHHGERSKWVARKLNEKLPHWAAPITGRWVTQNQAAIEAEVAHKGKE